MARPVVLTSKFLGIASLGLLSSSALTLSLSTVPALLSLPSPSDALPAFYKLRQHAAAAHRILAATSSAFLVTAFLLSPKYFRHPYMLWMAVTVGLGTFGVPAVLRVKDFGVTEEELEDAEEGRGRSGKEMKVNGEVVREGMEGWKKVLGWQSLVWSVGWAMGTVGIWGDGY